MTKVGNDLIEKIQNRVKIDIQDLGNNGFANMTKAIENEMDKIYVSKDAPGLERHPKGYMNKV